MKNAKQFQSWLKKKPLHIRALARLFPPGRYRIREGAPYTITCPGTEVSLASYSPDGKHVGVIVEPKDLLPLAVDHIRQLNLKYNNPPDNGLDTAMAVTVGSKWLELIESYVR